MGGLKRWLLTKSMVVEQEGAMRATICGVGIGLIVIGFSAGSVMAEPLLNLPVCSTARLIVGQADRTPDCTPNATQRKIAIKLEARTGPRTGKELIANYDVPTDNYNGSYMPPVVEARPGDTITFSIHDVLAPEVKTLPMVQYVRPSSGEGPITQSIVSTTLTNLHTHGLIVSANNATNIEGNGDNPFRKLDAASCVPMVAMPGMAAVTCVPTSGDVVIAIPTALAAGVYGNPANAAHPSGLFWYHPHIHGIAQHQVNGGMAGLISIGDPRTAIIDPANPSSTALRSKIDVRYLAIKDIQILAGAMPETATAINHPSGAWQGQEFNTQFCGDINGGGLGVAKFGKGYCTPAAMVSSPRQLWMFTVNGQRYPTITVPQNRGHIWRMANLSATVSYQLHLTDSATGNDVPMRVVALDGVVSGRHTSGGTGTPTSPADAIQTTSIRLMPASRVEIYVPNFRKHSNVRKLVLRTSGVKTGPDADLWPPIDLAEVRLAAVTTNRSGDIKLAPLTTNAGSLLPAMNIPADAPRAGSITAATMPLCAHNRLGANERRVITFGTDHPKDPNNPTQTVEVLEVGSAIMAAGSATPIASLPVQTMKHDMDFTSDDHACAVLGSQEVWEIVNETGEIHNFHIHQSKFRQATASEIALTGGGTGPAVRAPALTTESTDPLFGTQSDGLGVWHDTFPIPAGKPGQPAHVFLHIAFTAPEQIGRYVYHCHILEHEDKGMMAPFEVLAP